MKFRLTTEADLHLPYYSHSIVEAINTCPRWGIIRYVERKYFKSQYRSMALEAGSAMHEAFAAFRLCQLAWLQERPDAAEREAQRLFPHIWEDCFEFDTAPVDEHGVRDHILTCVFKVLNMGNFYDDPDDKVRTLANLEISVIRLVDELLNVAKYNEVYVADGVVGVEQSFDFVVDDKIRFIGTMDGLSLHRSRDGVAECLRLEELKTASRLDDAFRESWRIKSQPVPYMIAARLATGAVVDKVRMIGIKVKQTRSNEDFRMFEETRDDDKIQGWYNTLMFTHELVEKYKSAPLEAPQFTHSCNRYFRPCGFVDLCGADAADQHMIYESMEETPPSPSEAAILEKWSNSTKVK